jgi:hypothetical protein
MVMCAAGTPEPPSSSSGVPVMAHPGRASTASSPNSTSIAVTALLESLTPRWLLRLIHSPPGRASHFPSPLSLSLSFPLPFP